jgi:hypothetical protein
MMAAPKPFSSTLQTSGIALLQMTEACEIDRDNDQSGVGGYMGNFPAFLVDFYAYEAWRN